jgi:REP element-mobilizing transposase RayT
MNRGNRKEIIFRDDLDRQRFLETLGNACLKTGWQVHAYCLMPNHFHLVLETPQANLVEGMKWLLTTYAIRFNLRHHQTGHLLGGRYKSQVVDGSGNGYFKTVCDYIHLNPARARLLTPKNPLSQYPWSSWPAYLLPAGHRPAWLRVDRLLGEYRVQNDSAASRQLLETSLEERRAAEQYEDYTALRSGWCVGSTTFKESLATLLKTAGPQHFGPERGINQAAHAEGIVADELQRRGWTDDDLAKRLKGDPEKIAIAQRLRRETVMTVAWVAQRLRMGRPNYLNFLLHRKPENNLSLRQTEKEAPKP